MHTLTKQISKTVTAVVLREKKNRRFGLFRISSQSCQLHQGPAVLSLASASLSGEGASESVIRSDFFGSLKVCIVISGKQFDLLCLFLRHFHYCTCRMPFLKPASAPRA